MDLLKKLLAKNPDERITASEALSHDWIKQWNIQKQMNPFDEADNNVGIEDENSKIHEKIKKMQEE